MFYIYPQIILALALALYFYDRYLRQKVKNLTTLGLAVGFLSFALVGLIQFIISAHLLSWDYKILYFLRYLFLVSALIHIFWATIRLVTENFFLKIILPILIYISAISFAYVGVFILEDAPLVTLIASFALYVPIDLTLGILFLLLYSRLAFLKDGFKSNLGPFLISLGWFIHAINASRVAWVIDKPGMEKCLIIVVIPYILWLIGFILLEKETEKAFESKMKIYGLRRRGERE